MKTVLLVGDSIRMGYQAGVRARLADRALVLGPEENGGNSRNVLTLLDGWLDDAQPDVLHINCGLHDLKREFGTGELAVPLAEYAANVERILTLACRRVAEVIWATTTPVNETWHHANKPFDRLVADVDAYNEAALVIVREAGLLVDELFAAITSAGPDRLLREDGVHFKPEGYALLADTVVQSLSASL